MCDDHQHHGTGRTHAHHCLHHVWLRVAQRFGSKEHVDHAVVTDHLQNHGAGAEGAAPAAAVPAPERPNARSDTNRKTRVT